MYEISDKSIVDYHHFEHETMEVPSIVRNPTQSHDLKEYFEFTSSMFFVVSYAPRVFTELFDLIVIKASIDPGFLIH